MNPPAALPRRFAWLGPVAAGVLALIFAWAGVAKLADPAAFASAIDGYRLNPPLVSSLLAVYLPWLELTLALGLLLRKLRRPSALLGTVLMLVFSAATGAALVRGLDINCGCFGSGHPTTLGLSLIRDLIFLFVALLATRR